MIKGTTDREIFERIRKLIVNQKGIEEVGEITPDTSLRKDLKFDSLGLAELTLASEDEFGIAIPAEDEEFKEVDTIREAVSYFGKRLGI